jgi:hypothetical protein
VYDFDPFTTGESCSEKNCQVDHPCFKEANENSKNEHDVLLRLKAQECTFMFSLFLEEQSMIPNVHVNSDRSVELEHIHV